MQQKTSFKIFNSSNTELEIIHEPECFSFNLPINEEIIVETNSCRESIQLKMSVESGRIVVAILDENSLYGVLHNNEDIFSKYK